MAKVVSSSNPVSIVKKRKISEKKVSLSRVATDLQYMGDVDFGVLGEDKDGLLVSYDSVSDRFILVTPDQVLSESVSDQDLPDSFVRDLETELSLGQIALEKLDGGSFWSMSKKYTTQLRNLGDVSFGILDSLKNNQVVKYDHSQQKFVLTTADSILVGVTTISDIFATQVEDELIADNIGFVGLDGGSF